MDLKTQHSMNIMNLFFRSTEALKVILKSHRGLAPFLQKGASIASTRVLSNVRTFVPHLHSVIDAGANKGQFALTCLHYYPEARIYSFEPVPDTFQKLSRNIQAYPHITPFHFALGSEGGSLDFYQNAHSHASSFLPVTELQKSIMPRTARAHKIQVPVHTLDLWAESIRLEGPTLLKMDVQGYEKEILRGATQTLSSVDYLLFECSFRQMHEGEPLFEDMHAFVRQLGYDLVAPVGYLESGALQIIQMDLLYKRRSSE